MASSRHPFQGRHSRTTSERPLDELLDEIAARTPAPASGTAASLAGALAASLAELTARFSDDDEAAAHASSLRARLVALGDEDAEAYRTFARTKTAEARERTIDVPLAIAEAAAEVAALGERLRLEGNRNLVGDATAATLLAGAVVRVGAELVGLNLGGSVDARAARARTLVAGLPAAG